MGLETLALIAGTASTIKNAVDSFSTKSPSYGPTLTYKEAEKQAGAQLNPLYDQRMKDVTLNTQKDLNNRGFTGQQAGNELTTSVAADNERQRISAVNGLANSLVQNSADDSYRRAALDSNYKLQSTNQANNAWMDSLNWIQKQPVLPNLKNLKTKASS